jgi:hypothetical protein
MRIIPIKGKVNLNKTKGEFVKVREDGELFIKINEEGITTIYFGEMREDHFYYYVVGLSGRTKEQVIEEIKKRYEFGG